jgi:hypothetical protein
MTSRTHTPEDVQKIMESWRDSASEYERGFIDGMQKQMQSSVDKAVNAMTKPTYYIPNKDERTWVGLTDEEIRKWWASENGLEDCDMCKIDDFIMVARAIEAKLKEKNT